MVPGFLSVLRITIIMYQHFLLMLKCLVNGDIKITRNSLIVMLFKGTWLNFLADDHYCLKAYLNVSHITGFVFFQRIANGIEHLFTFPLTSEEKWPLYK